MLGYSPTSVYDPTLSSSIMYTTLSPMSPYSPYSPYYSPVPLSPYVGPVVTTTESKDAMLDSPVLTSLNLTYSKPTFGFYENTNTDPELHEKMVKHFYYYKLLGEWIYEDMIELLGYLKADKSGNIELVKSVNDYDPKSVDKDSDKVIEKKIEFMRKNVFRPKDMMNLLRDLVHEAGVNWYDLPHKERMVMKAIKRGVDKRFRKIIEKK